MSCSSSKYDDWRIYFHLENTYGDLKQEVGSLNKGNLKEKIIITQQVVLFCLLVFWCRDSSLNENINCKDSEWEGREENMLVKEWVKGKVFARWDS